MEKMKEEQQNKRVQEEIEKKVRADARAELKIIKEEEKQKEKGATVKQEADNDAEKAGKLTARPPQKNSPNGVQKNRK